MEHKEIYSCQPFRVWVEPDGALFMKLGTRDAIHCAPDVAAILGACLIEGAAYITKATAEAVKIAGESIEKDKNIVTEAAAIADRFTKLE